jgi:hypothetical protein
VHRRHKYLQAAAFGVLLAGLGCTEVVQQQVSGRVLVASVPATQMSLRLYHTNSCSGEFVETKTDGQGNFLFTNEGKRGSMAVIVQKLALCRKNDRDAWIPVWSSTHDGATARFQLECDLSRPAPAICDGGA